MKSLLSPLLAVFLLLPQESVGPSGPTGQVSEQSGFGQVRRVLTNAEVVSLHTSPITLLPARPGYWYYIVSMGITKAAGAYTVNSAADWRIKLGSTGYLSMDAEAGFMTEAGVYYRYRDASSNTAAVYSGFVDGAMIVDVTAGSFSGSGGACTLWINYIAVRY